MERAVPVKRTELRSDSFSGFTLVELNLALAIAAVLGIVMFSLYGVLSRSTRDQQQRRRGGAAIAHALSVIAHDFTLSMPIYGHEEGGFLLIAEEGPRGLQSQVAFSVSRWGDISDDPSDLRWFQTVVVEYSLQQRPGERGRLLQVERALIGPEALQPARTNVLVEGIDEFSAQVKVAEEWLDEFIGDSEEWDELQWPQVARIRLVGDRRMRGVREHEVEVVIPAGWTLAPAE